MTERRTSGGVPVRSSLLLAHGVAAVFHTALLFSLFMLVRGHNAPGGGFIGGLIAAAALILRALDRGVDQVLNHLRLPPAALLGLGVITMLATGVGGLILGGTFLKAGTWTVHLPLFGPVKVVSTLAFDTGVYLAVLGVGLAVLDTFGRRVPR